MNPFAQSVFSMTAPCLPCCEQPVPGCACALLLPIFSTPYVDYETAEAVLTSYAEACYFYGYKETPVGIASFDSFNADAITLTSFGYDARGFAVYDPSTEIYQPPALNIWTSVSLVDGDTLEIAFTAGASLPGPWYGDIHVYVYDCNGVELESFYAPEEDEPTPGPTSGTFNFTVPADGVYYIYVISGAGDFTTGATGSSYTEVDVEFTATAIAPNPVIALWDDSGTTRQLEACPKLLLPPQVSPLFGTWYADATEAQDALDNYVSNCIGYWLPVDPSMITTFSATGTDSLNYTASMNANGTALNNIGPMFGSLSMEAGDTPSVDFVVSSLGSIPTAGMGVEVYDDTGTMIDSGGLTGAGGTLALSPVPADGIYTFSVVIFGDGIIGPGTDQDMSTTVTISSDGANTAVCLAQALYDLGLECPGRIDCIP